jgi:hypothetical protein
MNHADSACSASPTGNVPLARVMRYASYT